MEWSVIRPKMVHSSMLKSSSLQEAGDKTDTAMLARPSTSLAWAGLTSLRVIILNTFRVSMCDRKRLDLDVADQLLPGAPAL